MFDVNFEVKVREDKFSLQGLSAYEAATRCAVMSARRPEPEPEPQSQQVDGAAGAAAAAAGGASASASV
ncbi:hypothetical protein HXX76_009574 [Chlamydomonas incerta]|uniref:Uncharacterized protein n=1 Tax=Chlamydomonas incerta TaxID=51695 RepID=A0A835VXH9_CHLIN|nr:hypothetical protein HXX76_009574 [Chlamydomonas incerta]|eukprot:KAG2431560.1 hypothetical protein HXX76_009574 [Chlamydomonas incerta]